MKTSRRTNKLIERYLTIQNELMVMEVSDITNTFSSYDTVINFIKPKLTSADIALFQPLTMIDGEKAITTRIQHQGQFMESTITISEIKEDVGEDINSAQKDGMSITFMKRYCLLAFFALAVHKEELTPETLDPIIAGIEEIKTEAEHKNYFHANKHSLKGSLHKMFVSKMAQKMREIS